MTFKQGESGNPLGRPKGIRDRRSLFREMVEPYKDDLVKKAVELALAGNEPMLRLLLSRLLPVKPKEESLSGVQLAGEDLAENSEEVLRKISEGAITLSEANSLFQILLARSKLVELAEVMNDIEEIKKMMKQTRLS